MSDFIFSAPDPKTIEEGFSKALFAAAEQIGGDCNRYVKNASGTTHDTMKTRHKDMTLNVMWTTEYAKYAYYRGKPSKEKNPEASLMWADVAARRWAGTWGKIIAQGMGAEYKE